MYRRNQVETAIARSTWQTSGPDSEPMLSCRNDLKRLIDTDRSFPDPGVNASPSERRFAFAEGEGSGKGVEQDYSALDALALMVAFSLCRAGLTQRRAVRKVRQLRPWLKREVTGRLALTYRSAFAGRDERNRERSVNGIDTPIEDESRRLYLALALDDRNDLIAADRDEIVNLFTGRTSMSDALNALGVSASPVLVIDLGSAFVRLVHWLDRTPPAKRGRKG